MSLVTYEQTRPWAESIRKEVTARQMPPFHADGPLGYYKDDVRLTSTEIQLIADWVDAGAKQGNPEDLPPTKTWTGESQSIEEPDLFLTLPVVTPLGTGTDEWWTLYSDYTFPNDTWIRGAHLIVGKESAIHHAHLFVVAPNTPIPPDGKIAEAKSTMNSPLVTWFPGLKQSLLPDRLGELVPKGSRIAMQTHFGPNAVTKTERPAIGIYFANGEIETTEAILGPKRAPLNIAPYESEHIVRSTNTFNVSGTITHFQSHMHLRGKSSRIDLRFPDGRMETVFDLPMFNFDWQRYYYLAEPKWVPAGTVAEFIGTWDNSTDNPNNPDPSQRIHSGGRTTDEMFGLHIYYTPDLKLPKTYVVKKGQIVDSRDNPETGPWVLFWKNVVDREWLVNKLNSKPNGSDIADDNLIIP